MKGWLTFACCRLRPGVGNPAADQMNYRNAAMRKQSACCENPRKALFTLGLRNIAATMTLLYGSFVYSHWRRAAVLFQIASRRSAIEME